MVQSIFYLISYCISSPGFPSKTSHMKLSEENLRTLLLTLHQVIEQNAEKTADRFSVADVDDLLVYPTNGGFSKEEEQAVMQHQGDNNLVTALRKILADNSAKVVFDFLQLLDGVARPDEELGNWSGVILTDMEEDTLEENEMLHDRFFESYRDWKKLRPEKGWALDVIEE